MPERPAELLLRDYRKDRDNETANEVVTESGFYVSEGSGAIIEDENSTIYHYMPFEQREENIQLLDQCVEDLKKALPGMEIWLEEGYFSDYGKSFDYRYELYVAPDNSVV